MTTLEQLVNDQKQNEMSDVQVIKTFFTLNDMEEEAKNRSQKRSHLRWLFFLCVCKNPTCRNLKKLKST